MSQTPVMQDFWNERYAAKEFIYGEEPNVFFREQLDQLEDTGTILLPADGEGRNGVYAAQMGLEVTSFDYSSEARKKAMDLASRRGVTLTYHTGSLETVQDMDNYFDVAALIFAHVQGSMRREFHRGLIKLLKPGGTLILQGYSKEQIRYQQENPQSGGPRNDKVLFDEEMLQNDFRDLDIQLCKTHEVELSEGAHHVGKASVIDLVARKPAD